MLIRRLVTTAVAALIATTAAVMPLPASAKPASPAMTPKCAVQARNDAALAGSRATTAKMTCVDTVAPSTGTTTALAVPSTCADNDFIYTRFTACVIRAAIMYVYEVPTGRVVGHVKYRFDSYITTSASSNRWTLQQDFEILETSGDLAGTFFTGDGACEPACTADVSFPNRPFSSVGAKMSATNTATSTSITPGSNVVLNHRTTMRHWFHNVAWQYRESDKIPLEPGRVRCDGEYTVVGCTFPVRPVFTIVARPGIMSFAKHVRMSLDYQLPRVLTRMKDEFNATQNGNKACPARIPKPSSDWSCDEYPFRSTLQGAFTSNAPYGRTFEGCQINLPDIPIRQPGDSGGYNICLIPATENTAGGLLLKAFYRDNRVLDGERFIVTVTGI
jgi:hypothetical protein